MYWKEVILQKMLRFIIKSGFKSRAGYNGACTLCYKYTVRDHSSIVSNLLCKTELKLQSIWTLFLHRRFNEFKFKYSRPFLFTLWGKKNVTSNSANCAQSRWGTAEKSSKHWVIWKLLLSPLPLAWAERLRTASTLKPFNEHQLK